MEKCKKILINKGFCMMMALVLCLTLFGSISANAATRADDIAGSFTNLSEYSNVDIYLNEMWVHSPPLGAQGNFDRIENHDTM